MTKVVGIDPSSKKLAFCTTDLSKGVPELHTVSLPEGIRRATGCAYREAFSFFQYGGQEVVYMEAPVVGRSIHPTIVQAQVGGAVMAAADSAGVKLHLVNNMSWKKKVVGKGNASKEEVASWLQQFWPSAYDVAEKDQDLIDACGVNRFGVANQLLMKAILNRRNRGRKA